MRDLVLVVTETGDRDYRHIIGRIARWENDEHVYTMHGWNDKPNAFYDNLVIDCQIGGISGKRIPYAWDFGYRDVHTVTIESANKMLKTLRRLTNAMTKLDNEFGGPTTYADYMIRIGNALKIKGFVFKSKDGQGFQIEFETQYAKHCINSMIADAVDAVCGEIDP